MSPPIYNKRVDSYHFVKFVILEYFSLSIKIEKIKSTNRLNEAFSNYLKKLSINLREVSPLYKNEILSGRGGNTSKNKIEAESVEFVIRAFKSTRIRPTK